MENRPLKNSDPSSLPPDEQATSASDSTWKVYKDGLGSPIPNEDWSIREKAAEVLKKVLGKSMLGSSPRVEYEEQGRAGNVIYVDGPTRIELWYEMGGGECKLFINIPTAEEWERLTRTPLARREEILHFIAGTVRREKAPSWRYEIHEREIAYY